MKKVLFYLFIVTIFLFCFSLIISANPNKIAEVGGKTITWLNLQNRYEKLWRSYLADNSQFPTVSKDNTKKDLKKIALNQLILEKLYESYAQEHNISFSPPEVEAIFRQIYSNKDIFLTDGEFDRTKFEKFKNNYPKRYGMIVEKLRMIFSMIK